MPRSDTYGLDHYLAIPLGTSAIVRASSVSLQKLLIIVEGTFRIPHLASGVVGIRYIILLVPSSDRPVSIVSGCRVGLNYAVD